MTFTERYLDVIKTKDFFEKEYNGDYCFENNIILNTNIFVTGHFANCVSLSLECKDYALPLYNNTHNIGYILRALIEFFDKEQDSSVNISVLENTPIRLVIDDRNPFNGKVVAIGHFMKDRFILVEDLMKLES